MNFPIDSYRLKIWPVSLLLAVIACSLVHAQPAPSRAELDILLRDGSRLMVVPVAPTFRIHDHEEEEEVDVRWDKLRKIEMWRRPELASVDFRDQLNTPATFVKDSIEVEGVMGRFRLPVAEIQEIRVAVLHGDLNVAFGKPADDGMDNPMSKQGLIHLTDGDLTTHSDPLNTRINYRVDLSADKKSTYCIEQVDIHWGRYGDRFNLGGCRALKPGEEPGDHVASYSVDVLLKDGVWNHVHYYGGRPVDEMAPDVVVERKPSKLAGCRSESVTRLRGLNLKGVVALRIRADGKKKNIALNEIVARGWKE